MAPCADDAMTVNPGRSFPLGATVVDGGVNFCVYSGRAKQLELLLFDGATDAEPARVIRLEAPHSPDVPLLARLRARPSRWAGLRVPGGRALRSRARTAASIRRRSSSIPTRAPSWCRTATTAPRRAARATTPRVAMRSVVVDPGAYDWEGDAPLRRPFATTVIYEMHVAGFTRHPSSGVRPQRRGTYAGMIEKIPYLQDLGITAVELLPGVPVRSRRTARPAWSTTGGIRRSPSSRRTPATARGAIRSAPSTSSGIWSRRCIAQGSR